MREYIGGDILDDCHANKGEIAGGTMACQLGSSTTERMQPEILSSAPLSAWYDIVCSVLAENASTTTIIRMSREPSRIYRLNAIGPLKPRTATATPLLVRLWCFFLSIKIQMKRKRNENKKPGNPPDYNRVLSFRHVLWELYIYIRVLEHIGAYKGF